MSEPYYIIDAFAAERIAWFRSEAERRGIELSATDEEIVATIRIVEETGGSHDDPEALADLLFSIPGMT